MQTREREAFRLQKGTAKERGIRFQFTFESWIAWWFNHLGPNWMKLRGARKGKYCMARRGDKGPYVAWNVECRLFEDNCRDRKQNGSTPKGSEHGMAEINEEVARAIYLAVGGSRAIARRFGVSRDIVTRVRHRETWRHATENLPPPKIKKLKRLTALQVKQIYLHPGSVGEIARTFDCQYVSVWRIKKRLDWRQVTDGLKPPPENLWGRLGGHALKGKHR